MEVITLDVDEREVGKRASKNLRREGKVPCVLYGHGAEPVHFSATELSLRPLIYTAENHLIDVKVSGKTWPCILRSVDFHPATELPIHADFQILRKGEKVRMSVPVRFVGTPVGQIDGGDTQFILNELEIECLPKDIPAHYDIDISALGIGDTLHVYDLDPGDFKMLTSQNQAVVTVTGSIEAIEEELEVEAVEEGEEPGEESEEPSEPSGED